MRTPIVNFRIIGEKRIKDFIINADSYLQITSAGLYQPTLKGEKMKRYAWILGSILVVSLVMAASANAKPVEIGVAWAGKSGMAKRVLAGLETGLKELGVDAAIEYKKELESVDVLSETVAQWQGEKQGMVLLRSNATKWLAVNAPTIPTFIGACNHPTQLGAVKNLTAPEGNITGVTYFLPVATQFDVFKAILPELKSVLLILEKGHPSALIDQEGTKDVCQKLGIEYNEVFASTTDEAQSAAEKYKGKVSAIIIGNQSLNIDNAENIVKAAGTTPVLSYSSKPVKVGALGGFVADDNRLGRMLAQSLADVLVNGKAIKSVPVKVDPAPKFYVNAGTAQRLGIEVPFEILESASIIE